MDLDVSEKSVQMVDTKEAQRVMMDQNAAGSLNSTIAYDFHGQAADKGKTGGWKASPFIIVNEVAERLAYYAIAVNMFTYVVFEMHESIPTAASFVTNWIGAAFVLTLLGAFVADAYWGRFKTIIVFSCIYAIGMILLTLSASISSLRPPKCNPLAQICQRASTSQLAYLYVALYIIALGTAGIKPCVSSFGADQFDEEDDKERKNKYSFFNWFFFAINMGALLGITVLVYVQDNYGWVLGFGIPTGAMIVSIFVFASGTCFYRFKKPTGSPFTRFAQVIVSSLRKWSVKVNDERMLYEVNHGAAIHGARRLAHTRQYGFLDKAAIVSDADGTGMGGERELKNRWKLCTVTQVEELKSFLRVIPIWASTIALSISFAQLSTYFVGQGRTMDRKLGPHFEIPPASLPIFSTLNALFLIPLYDSLIVPILRKRTGIERGITSLQRMGIGLFISIFAMVSAAVIEERRLQTAKDNGLLDKRGAILPMSIFWLVPQFFLIGSAEVFTYVGQLEFFYDEAADGTRSLSSALFLSEIGIGSWISTLIVDIIERSTGGQEKGWLRDNLNRSRLDLFYWILAGISLVNFIVFLIIAKFYRYANHSSAVLDESNQDNPNHVEL